MLFEPINISQLEIPNRFVRSATHEWLAENNGKPTYKLAEMYEELARNEVGLIITGYSYVNPRGKSANNQQGIYTDDFIEPYSQVVSKVHRYNSKIMLQIVHGGRQSLVSKDYPALAPSAVTDEATGITPVEMSESQILQTIEDFANAARRAKAAGFDGVQLHCAHGFLLSNFISPYTNQRTDKWGGSVENRTRIITEIIKRIRGMTLDMDYPITVKLNSTDGFGSDSDKPGLDINDTIQIAKILQQNGVNAIEVSGGIFETHLMSQQNIDSVEKEAYFKKNAKLIKNAVDIPVILVGGVRSKYIMEKIISADNADMISMSRPFICEPDFVAKIKEGISEESQCVSCNLCFDSTGIKCNYFKKSEPSTSSLN
ncbi:NADH:flavin oxidoreductase/NADH oxidase [Methanohalobium evestigatum Z-7303]|uniref:NADH:flavin oxidoreductase/NADH oxidase n=1 Tax=Methanohalobium evestigatum (strain ATCC BAA-1072 / DSM 3721 / NBRC 107634 / OCM 161 / Z-7303) TaxID=644295 RepID=D7E9K5_METEZ|nr:NADH:flavin oxidoreductase [Methanohalobium evestigatum]ADI74277.1 NADH:flavin oxidoreductase/NADH oxidase [Methanohalobium evestigatum Z-7303]